MAEDLSDMQRRINNLSNAEHEHELLWKIKDICKKHDIGKYTWRDDSLIEELDKALQSHYPKDLDQVQRSLQNALNTLSAIEFEYSGENGVEE